MRNEESSKQGSNVEFDPTLARALQQIDAPVTLEMRLMAAAEKESRKAKVLSFPQKRAWMSGAIAAALMMGVVIGDRVHVDHKQREEVAQTQQKFDDAVRVTNRALDTTQERLAKAGLSLGE